MGYGKIWRREWDSNPRYSLKYTRFPSVRLKPLGHLSGEQADCMNLTYLRLSLGALRQPIGPQESGVWQRMKAHTPEHALIDRALLPSHLRISSFSAASASERVLFMPQISRSDLLCSILAISTSPVLARRGNTSGRIAQSFAE